VRRAVERRDREAVLAATAAVLADGLDGASSLTSKSMAAKALVDVLRELEAVAPAEKENDGLDDLAARRAARRARGAAAQDSARS